jgi:hypothetical protein
MRVCVHVCVRACACVRACVCRLIYPAFSARAPYCGLWPAPLYHTCPQYRINGMILGEKSYWIKHVGFDFLYSFVWNILILRGTERDVTITVHRAACKVSLFLPDFYGTWMFSIDFRKKILKYQISWISVHWEAVCLFVCSVYTDRHTWRSY